MNKYIILGLIVILGVSSNTKAETLSSALSNAYINNPIINSKRA